ncbi:hypothetical protein [Vagococcus sp.]|uniref:hypothetical protein n=1 Tax=Vagococcus sp. TaxID=1933889 RepID=UPI002FCC1136
MTKESITLERFLRAKQQAITDKQFNVQNKIRLQQINKERQLKQEKHHQIKNGGQLKQRDFRNKLKESDRNLGINFDSKMKIRRGFLFIILLAIGTLFLAVQSPTSLNNDLSIITYISLITIGFSIYNQLKPKKYSTIMTILLFTIGLFIIPYSLLFFIIITLISFQKYILIFIRHINSNNT